jgi:3'(2'), 5'-bisphosphate nucleotidase
LIVTAGGVITDLDGHPLRYNQADVRHRRGFLASNGHCHEALLAATSRFREP